MSLSFLQTIYTAYDPEDGQICEIRCLDAKRQAQPIIRYFGLTHLHKAHEYATAQAASMDVYMGVLPRYCNRSAGEGGRDSDVNRAAWLWCDIDSGDGTEKDVIEFLKHVKSRVPTPRFIGTSGSGGVHLYWQLRDVVTISDADDRGRFTSALRRLVAMIGTGAANIHADKACCNPSRILRIPHTYNHKHDPPRKVQAVSCPDSAPLTLDEWEALLPFEPLPARSLRPKFTVQQARDRNTVPPGLLAWAERGYSEGNRHHDLVGAAAFLRRDTDLPEHVAFQLLTIKAQNSPGRRPITDEELEKAWGWAG
jgi:hypothetical protein